MEQARSRREPVQVQAIVREGTVRMPVEIVDMSSDGVKLRTLDPLEVGENVWLKLRWFEALQVRVVWVNRFEAGCEFLHPLHPAVFSTALQWARAD